MVDKKDSTRNNSHEDGRTDRLVESRRKKRSRASPPGSKRENLGVENQDSTAVSSESISPPVLQAPDTEIETPGRLTDSQIAAIQWDFANGFSREQIIKVTGVKRATVFKYTQGIEQHPPPTVENTTQTSAADPPASSLSQPAPSAQPPKIIEVSGPAENDTESTRRPDPEPNGDGDGYLGYGSYGAYRDREGRRSPLPATDPETVNELLMLFGRDMRRRSYTNFVDYFEHYVIPMFERAEFWMANIPGTSPEEKDHNFRRYVWIVTKFLTVQKELGEYESVNNGVKQEES